MKHIAWHLVSTQLILTVMIIICSCLCNSLGAEMVRKFLTPSLALSKDLSACSQHWASFHIQSTLSLSPQAPYFCAMECPILGTQGIAPRLSLPLLLCLMPTFPGNPGCWEQLQLLSLLAAAAQKQGSMVQRCSLSGLHFFHLSLQILLDCANGGHGVSCPLSVPDASA